MSRSRDFYLCHTSAEPRLPNISLLGFVRDGIRHLGGPAPPSAPTSVDELEGVGFG